MMTTAKAFGITRPGDHLAATQFQQQQQAEQVDAKKFEILSEAIKKFMNNEITQEQLTTIQNSLK